MTLEACAVFALAQSPRAISFALTITGSGTTGECNAFTALTQSHIVITTECQTPCPGNSQESCGSYETNFYCVKFVRS